MGGWRWESSRSHPSLSLVYCNNPLKPDWWFLFFLFLNCVFIMSLSIKDASDDNNFSRWPANRNVRNQAILKNHGFKLTRGLVSNSGLNLDGCIICTFTSVNLLKKFTLTDGWVGRLEPVEQHRLMIVNFSSTYYSSIHPSIHQYAGALVSLIRLLSKDSLCVVSYPPSIEFGAVMGCWFSWWIPLKIKHKSSFLFVCF